MTNCRACPLCAMLTGPWENTRGTGCVPCARASGSTSPRPPCATACLRPAASTSRRPM
ncbi:Uncharacterised protein [Bordetella pertussis]|nr:Uncharacterised protein [Bordetella pertussis]